MAGEVEQTSTTRADSFFNRFATGITCSQKKRQTREHQAGTAYGSSDDGSETETRCDQYDLRGECQE